MEVELAALRLMGRLETLAWLAARIGLPVTPSVEFTHQHCRHGPAEGGPWAVDALFLLSVSPVP